MEVFRHVTGREISPPALVEEALFLIGRRGGKDRATSVLATYIAALCDHSSLVRGERGVLLVIAPDARQAKVQLDYIEGVFQSSPVLAKLISNRNADSLSLTNGIDVEVRAASFRRLRGLTCIAVIASEAAFWFSEDGGSSNVDTEILNSIRPTLATTRGPLVMITTPYSRRGQVWETYSRHYGPQGDPLILVAQGTSPEFNPTLPQALIDRALEKDAAHAGAEYLVQFRSDLELLFAREAVEACVEPDLQELPYMDGPRYVGFVDMAGGSGADSATLCIAHAEKDRAVVDVVRERRPKFSPSDVALQFSQVLKSYGIGKVTGDRWGGEFPREIFRANGIAYEPCERTKSDLYGDLLPIINSGRVVLLDNKRMVAQLAGLERRVSRTGKDNISHAPGPGRCDDLANCVAGAVVTVLGKSRPIPDDAVFGNAGQRTRYLELHGPRPGEEESIWDQAVAAAQSKIPHYW